MRREWFYVFISVSLILICEGNTPSACLLKETCSSCIRTLGCVWCALPMNSSAKEGESLTRCVHVDHQPQDWCPHQHIVNLRSKLTTLESKPLSPGSLTEEAVQIFPQRIHLSLRLGEEFMLPIEYQQAVGYPVDLYYLMDLSASMADDRKELSNLGKKLAFAMKAITNNFRIGFGSFVDKPEMPYVSTVPDKLKKPCDLPDGTACASPYSFKNQMPLTTNTDIFSREVNNAPVSGNMDYPEGGFDALMQAIVCTDEIGWRQKARRLLVFSTDAGFHMAGDGKLAGLVEPNDELCHLDKNGSYTYALRTDYPSISQIDKKARENNINIIFAVTKNQGDLYKVLKDNIHAASYGTLSKDSSNVVELVKAEYDKLVDSISLSDDSEASVEIQYFSKCLGTENKQRNECGGLRGRPKIQFNALIKALSCPENRSEWNQVIHIKPGVLNESLTIDLQIICQCPCEQQGHMGFEANSITCNGGGNLECGVCSCDSGQYGRFCECNGNDANTITSDISRCRPENNTEEVCSGLGFCKCGKCDCMKRADPKEIIYGTFCECDNFSCKRYGGHLCSGSDRGRCNCGHCDCFAGWSGPACECIETNATCIAPDSEDVCSGHGNCVCGSCQCSLTNDRFLYSGRYCEECPNCKETRCDELASCVECQVHNTGLYSEDECKIKCTAFQTEIQDLVDLSNISDSNSIEKLCQIPDNSGCTTIFKYKYEDDNVSLKVIAQKTKECTVQKNIMAVVLGVVGSTVIAGLILLVIWKILTSIHDKREYIKFEKERQMAKWDRGDNPLYKPSTSTFNNPTFRKN